MVNNKIFSHRPIEELMAIVRNDLRQLDDEGLIDEGTVLKTVMACNARLGVQISEIFQVCIPVENYRAKLPANFEKLYFVTALMATNTSYHTGRNPLDFNSNNHFDSDVVYKAKLDRGTLGCVESYGVTIERATNTTVHNTQTFINLDVNRSTTPLCHVSCPNVRKKGQYTVSIEGDDLVTPFRSGEVYIMYIGTMEDEFGNILFPFHPLITPYYEWSIKEKVLQDAIFNSDGNYGDLLKYAQTERVKAWLDAFGVTTEPGFGEVVDRQRKKELGWYNEYFKYLQ